MRPDDNASRPIRVVVSGGISSGKSVVSAMLADLGAVVIEADRIGHEVLEPEGAAFAAVTLRWPAILVNGRIDRGRLAAIVFSDSDQLAELEAISHPFIAAEIARRIAAAGDSDVVLELPLASDLVGPGWTRIVIDAAEDLRLERAIARGMSAIDAASRMKVQPGRSEWASVADVVIENSGTLSQLETDVREVWRNLKNKAG